MLEWLLILGLITFAFSVHKRLRTLEMQLAEMPLGWSHAGPDNFELQESETGAFARTPQAPEVALEPEPQPDSWPAPEPIPHVVHAEPWEPAVELQDSVVEEEAPSNRFNFSFSFEDLFGRRLPIWAGGITLAVAGVLIVKLSIEAGLISPSVRVILGALFGFLLIAGAEAAFRFEDKVRDVRVRQALAGAGVASLYSSCLMAANMYQLIGATPAMLGMAAVTALALLLAVRFGAPSALLGLIGGLSAPALIGSDDPNVPLLSLYLALAVGGLCTLSRNQKWAWLGVSALVGGFGWGLLLLLGGALDMSGSVSVAVLLLLLGIGFPALTLAGDRRNQLQLAASVIAAAQMAALVATGGFAMLRACSR